MTILLKRVRERRGDTQGEGEGEGRRGRRGRERKERGERGKERERGGEEGVSSAPQITTGCHRGMKHNKNHNITHS